MRITLVSPYDLDVPGGVQSHVTHLAAALRGLGDEVTVLGPRRDHDGGLGRSVGVPFNDSVAPVALSPTVLRRTRVEIARSRPDVIHVHEPMVPWVGLAAATTRSTPVVGTFHAWSDRDRLYRAARPLGRRLVAHLDAAVAVSAAAASYHAGALGLPVGAFQVVPNGVEVARFSEAPPFSEVTEDDAPTLLFVGRLERRKGLQTLVKAFTRLKADRPDLRLHVVGEGPEADRCRSLLPPALLADVTFHGRVPSEDVPRWFASCDLYVAPALGGESFGIVLLEAMAAGRPVVASDLPGYRSVATDGVQGCLVPPGDDGVLAEAIGVLLDNPARRRAMGAEGRRTAEEYDWSHVAGRLRAVYTELLAA
jgi:phosphatidyl-myo-inositol alpha-mannosyltransferase